MTYINIAKLVLINKLEKDHSMIEMHHLKNVIFIQIILSFVLSKNYKFHEKQQFFLELMDNHCAIHVIHQDIQGQLQENIMSDFFH